MSRVVGSVQVGQKMVWTEMLTCRFEFLNFADLKNKRGEMVESPYICCHGIPWSLQIYPNGDANNTEGFISMFLKPQFSDGTDDIKTKFSLRIKEVNDSAYTQEHTFVNSTGRGWRDFIKRKDVLDNINGTLTVEADIQIYTDCPEPWVGTRSLLSTMQKLLHSPSFADVTFIVGNSRFPAHRAILHLHAPVLAALAEDVTPDSNCIPLGSKDDPNIFKSLLHFVYTIELPDDTNIQRDGRKLLDMANKYGCVSMKLLIESKILALGLSVENSTDLLLYANSKNCALLQEAASKFICDNIATVMETDGWNEFEKSHLHTEMLKMALSKQRGSRFGKKDSVETDLEGMDVTTLRKKLDNLGLDLDGSREMLVDRLAKATGA